MLKLATAFRNFNDSRWSLPTCFLIGIIIGFLPKDIWIYALVGFCGVYGWGGNYLIDYYYKHQK